MLPGNISTKEKTLNGGERDGKLLPGELQLQKPRTKLSMKGLKTNALIKQLF